ncbi:alpha-ketoglutarate-dependent dioxygenase AlkB family protein [Vibrio ulleungensis]|uniref:Alpha-ketoglutarate-dependent dioxygenase AlkB n=1 Tax=Vibrio ulleungensis TaxID=2807619 RepID=A0ABS2HG94_9VIBR|nr:alpha-ketoglutarate-dependent dioxygenase AlkB [Vibrio ulleungensis]MBM7035153.1 alpha-ketoglutarate-dependent dioxygenase AlkB [Vibrio ulleungensis]
MYNLNSPLAWLTLPKQVADESRCSIAVLPNFISPTAAKALTNECIEQLDWQQKQIRLFGRWIDQPRLICGYGSRAYRYSGLTIEPRELPISLAMMRQAVSSVCGTDFNSVLGNYYRNGDDYMGWHQDNEAALGEEPTIASVSLGQRRKFVFKHKLTSAKHELWLDSGSLLVMAGAIQHHWMHALPKTKVGQQLRLNFTFRNIVA